MNGKFQCKETFPKTFLKSKTVLHKQLFSGDEDDYDEDRT
jgi:hypothetical protein